MEYAFSDRIKNMTGNAIRDIFKLLARPEVISFAGGMPAGGCASRRTDKGDCLSGA